MNKRSLIIFLILETLAILVAGMSFGLISNRLVAGAVAGTFFVSSGLYMVMTAWWWRDKWASLTWYPLLGHVFLIALPMVIVRFSQAALSFDEIKIFGLEGPTFHKLSTYVFSALMAGTILDLIRTVLAKKHA